MAEPLEGWVRDGAGWRLGDRYAEDCECEEVGPEWQGAPHTRELVPGTEDVWTHYYADEITQKIIILRITGDH